MNILLISGSVPYPPASGGALRVYGILKGLRAHNLTLLTFDDGQSSPAGLAEFCHVVTVPFPQRTRIQRLRDLLFSRQPDIARRLYSPVMAEHLRLLLTETTFDVIQVEGIEVACYLPLAKALQPQARLIFDTFNAEYVLQRVIFEIDRRELRRLPAALYSLIQAGRIRRFERAMCQLADAVIAVSEEDAEALRPFRADAQIPVIASGIFVDSYEAAQTAQDLGGDALVFTGKMDYRPNVDAMLWFGLSVFPAVRHHCPHVQLHIVGQMPHPRLDALRAVPGIHLTGRVDSVVPYLRGAAVYIAPLRMGSGTRLKLLEAMAARCAIVATTTAAAGLNAETRAAMKICDDPQEMAETIVQLLQDQAQCETLGAAANRAVRLHYDWAVLIPRLLAVYKDLGLG